jgi:hypothetical protein
MWRCQQSDSQIVAVYSLAMCAHLRPEHSGRRRLLTAGVGLVAVVAAGTLNSRVVRAAPLVPFPDATVRQTSPIDLPIFRLIVPFRTQKDGGPWQVSNCGPATLGMLLDAIGPPGQATDDLRFRAHTYQGTVGMRTGTALEHVAHVAEDFGLSTRDLMNSDGSFHHWNVDEVTSEVRLGHPVMPLVRLYLVPGYEGLSSRWGHYILITGIGPGGFYFSDALKTDPVAGTTSVISPAQLERAIEGSHIPGQAAAFAGQIELPVWTPDRA